MDIKRLEVESEYLNAIAKNTVIVQCAYCKKQNAVPVTLNQENRFVCDSCNNTNGIKMQFFSTQITTPIESLSKTPIEAMLDKVKESNDIN